MRRAICTMIFGAAALAAWSVPVRAQKQGQIFVSLTTPDGKPVDGLTAEEVMIQEDGMPCKVIKVESVAWPTKVQVLVDNGRANTNPINPLQNGLKEFFALMPEGTEMSLYATAGSPRPIVKPTRDRQKLVDGIALITPDNGSGIFFDALFEASERVDKDKTPSHNIIVMIASDSGQMRANDRDVQKLQQNIYNHGITTHIMMNVTGQGAGGQVDFGINIAKFSRGRYETLNSATRLATLIPDVGKTVAKAIALQNQQYRVTYERPAKAKEQGGAIGLQVRREGVVHVSMRGNQVPD